MGDYFSAPADLGTSHGSQLQSPEGEEFSDVELEHHAQSESEPPIEEELPDIDEMRFVNDSL